MSNFLKILAILALAFMVAFAQTDGDAPDSSDSTKIQDSDQSASTDDDDDDAADIGDFLRSLLGGDDDDSKSNSSYDYFQDKDGNGVDDRLQDGSKIGSKSSGKKSSGTSSSSTKSDKVSTKRTKTTKRRGK